MNRLTYMLKLIQNELIEKGISRDQIISINFEDLCYAYLHTAIELHDEIQEVEALAWFDVFGKQHKTLRTEIQTYLSPFIIECIECRLIDDLILYSSS